MGAYPLPVAALQVQIFLWSSISVIWNFQSINTNLLGLAIDFGDIMIRKFLAQTGYCPFSQYFIQKFVVQNLPTLHFKLDYKTTFSKDERLWKVRVKTFVFISKVTFNYFFYVDWKFKLAAGKIGHCMNIMFVFSQ